MPLREDLPNFLRNAADPDVVKTNPSIRAELHQAATLIEDLELECDHLKRRLVESEVARQALSERIGRIAQWVVTPMVFIKGEPLQGVDIFEEAIEMLKEAARARCFNKAVSLFDLATQVAKDQDGR